MKNLEHMVGLDNARVVIVGGSSGIGFATAQAVKARGAKVTLIGRSLEKLERAAAELGGADIAVANVGDRGAIETALCTIKHVDHLLITAGSLTLGLGKLADSDPDVLLQAFQERLAGPIYAIKAILPRMSHTGSITLTGGQFSDRPIASGAAVICAAVRGIEGLATALALELAPIRVNVIAPGFIDTPLFDAFGLEGKNAALQKAALSMPVQRVGKPDEVAHAITFLMANGYMSGEVLHIDGGGRLV